MRLNKQYSKYLIVSTIALILTGCASVDYGTEVDSNMLTIERQRSRIAGIGQVFVYQQNDGVLVRGEVQRSHFGRSAILGHVDIELLDIKDKVLYKGTANYKRPSLRGRSAKFSIKLNLSLTKGSVLSVKHHDSAHRVDCNEIKSNG